MSQRHHNIIQHYKRWKALHPDTWVEHSANQPTLALAIKAAASSFDNTGRKHPHQYRLKNQDLENYGDNLLHHIKDIENVQTFDELITIAELARIKGIGELAVYDTAVRIGAYLDIFPDRVYLHAGARIGATGLIGNIESNTLEKKDLPDTFQSEDLSCYELEDILCIYKAIFTHQRR